MSADEVRLGLLVLSLGALLTVHVVLLLRLFRKPQPLQGLVGLVVPPAAPVFAWQRGMHFLAALWGVFAVLYIVSFVMAR